MQLSSRPIVDKSSLNQPIVDWCCCCCGLNKGSQVEFWIYLFFRKKR